MFIFTMLNIRYVWTSGDIACTCRCIYYMYICSLSVISPRLAPYMYCILLTDAARYMLINIFILRGWTLEYLRKNCSIMDALYTVYIYRGGGIGLGRCLSRSVFHVTAPSLRFIQLSKRLPNRLKISLPVRIPLSPFSLPFCASVFHFLYSARFPSVPLLLFTFLSLCLPLFTSLSVSFSPVLY